MPSLEQFVEDVPYALRIIRRNPAFARVTVLTLALGIDINSAIFSLFDAVLLRLLPVRDPQQLYLLQCRHGGRNRRCGDPLALESREEAFFRGSWAPAGVIVPRQK
jgi:hypothetical protein